MYKSLQKGLALFITTAIGISLAAMLPLYFSSPLGVRSAGFAWWQTILLTLAGLGPAIAGIITSRNLRMSGNIKLGGPSIAKLIPWYILALIIVLANIVITIFTGKLFDIELSNFLAASNILPHAVLWAAFVALSGEFGWRGILYQLLKRYYSPFFASFITGAVWGLWQLPIAYFLLGNLGFAFIPLYLVIGPTTTVAVSFIMGYLFVKSEKSLPLMIFFHFLMCYTTIMAIKADLTLMHTLIHTMISAGIYFLSFLLILQFDYKTLFPDSEHT